MDTKITAAVAVALLTGLIAGRRAQGVCHRIRRALRRLANRNYGFRFYSPFDRPFEIHGLPYRKKPDGAFYRLPPHKRFSKDVRLHAGQTAGVRIKFHTDSGVIMLKAVLSHMECPPYCTRYGTVGFDVYSVRGGGLRWLKTLVPEPGGHKVSDTVRVGGGDVMICLPLYAGVKTLKIGVSKRCAVSCPQARYGPDLPVVFYGSSITQGASAGRAGTSFPFLVSRYFNVDFINLGFSASAKGEQSVAGEIAKIGMSAFVMEYDHNAGSPAELEATHFDFYRTIRAAHKDIPIVFISRISAGFSCSYEEGTERREVIKRSFDKAVKMGDCNLYFVDGSKITGGQEADKCLADGKHPNDLGMKLIADAVINTLTR